MRSGARLLIAMAVGAALLAAACGGDGSGQPPASSTPPPAGTGARPSPSSASPAAPASPAPYPYQALADGLALGPAAAKVTLAVYEDFQCPFCLGYTALIEPVILKEYVATGKIRYEFHHLPVLGQESALAAIAATCAAEQNLFWPYHDRLFKVQADAGQAQREQLNVGRFSAARLVEYATSLELARAAFDACLQSDRPLTAVQADIRGAQALGIRGTPGFVLNGAPLGTGPGTVAGWRTLLDAALKGP